MVVVVLSSLLATEAGGQKRFELEADTVGDALRALPVANRLLRRFGDGELLNRFMSRYVEKKTALGLRTRGL